MKVWICDDVCAYHVPEVVTGCDSFERVKFHLVVFVVVFAKIRLAILHLGFLLVESPNDIRVFISRHRQIDYVDVVNAGDIILNVSFRISWTFVLGCKLEIGVGTSFQVDCASSLLLEFPNGTS